MEINETMVRDFLLRQIANKNKRLSGMFKTAFASFRRAYNDGFGEILNWFVGGNQEPMQIIYEHMDRNPKTKLAAYNYFDIPTLISYDKFLGKILQEADIRSKENGHYSVSNSDYSYAFGSAKSWLRGNAYEAETGFYSRTQPVTLARNEEGRLDPRKTMSPQTFEKKYTYTECLRQIDKYNQRQELIRNGIDPDAMEEETIEYTYKGKKLTLAIRSKEYYTDAQGSGLTYIKAIGKEGMLIATYDAAGNIYEGDLYDLDGELVFVDGGGAEFFANASEFGTGRPLVLAAEDDSLER